MQSKSGRKIAKQKLLAEDRGDIEMGPMSEPPSWVRHVEGTMTLFEVSIHLSNLRTTTSQKCEAVPRRARI